MASQDISKDVEMTAPPEAVAVGPDYSSIASSMALVREEEEIHSMTNGRSKKIGFNTMKITLENTYDCATKFSFSNGMWKQLQNLRLRQ